MDHPNESTPSLERMKTGEASMRFLTLNGFLGRLIWVCVLPLAILAAYLAYYSIGVLKKQQFQEAKNLSHNVAAAIDRHLDGHISGLQLLAASPFLDEPVRLEAFYKEMQGFHESFGGHVILADLSMQMLSNTRSPLGAALPKLPVPKGFAAAPAVLATKRPAVGDTFWGPIAKEPLIAVVVPVIRDGAIRHLLVNTLETRQFAQHLNVAALPDEWVLKLFDGSGVLMVQRPVPETGIFNQARNPTEQYVSESSTSAWSVVLEIPAGVHRSSAGMAAVTLVLSIAVITLASVIGARLAGRRLAWQVHSLVHPLPNDGQKPSIMEIEAVRNLLNDASNFRESAEKSLKESEEKYRLLAEYASDVIWILDLDAQRFRYVSPSVERLRGFTPEEVMAQDMATAVTPESLAKIQKRIPERIERFRKGIIEFYSDEVDQLHRDGTLIKTEVSSRYLQNHATGHLEVVGVSRDVTQRKKAEEALRNSLEEKVALLKEVHHRVKNNLQIVASLLTLQANRSGNPEVVNVLEDTRNRVKSMALLHETLYRSEGLARIHFTRYVKDLCGQLMRSFGSMAERIQLENHVEGVKMPLEQAVPCGLIISELVSNALKHGFPDPLTGRIAVRLAPAGDGKLMLSVEDTGVGLPHGHDPGNTATLGLQLVARLASQLGGELRISASFGAGAAFQVLFPIPKDTLIKATI